MRKQKDDEPKFMRDLHAIRAELARLPRKDYEAELRRAWEIYRKKLGHLYVEAAASNQ